MLMRWLGGAAALLVLGLTVSARAGDDGTTPSSEGHWWDKLNPFASKKAETPAIPPTVPVAATAAAARTLPATATAPAIKPVAACESEEDAYLRRLGVCDRLMEIAQQTDNKELERQVELLKARVWEVCKQRSGITSNSARFESDEAVIKQYNENNRREPVATDRTRTDRRTATVQEEGQ